MQHLALQHQCLYPTSSTRVHSMTCHIPCMAESKLREEPILHTFQVDLLGNRQGIEGNHLAASCAPSQACSLGARLTYSSCNRLEARQSTSSTNYSQ